MLSKFDYPLNIHVPAVPCLILRSGIHRFHYLLMSQITFLNFFYKIKISKKIALPSIVSWNCVICKTAGQEPVSWTPLVPGLPQNSFWICRRQTCCPENSAILWREWRYYWCLLLKTWFQYLWISISAGVGAGLKHDDTKGLPYSTPCTIPYTYCLHINQVWNLHS